MPKNLIMGLVLSKTGYQHIEFQHDNLTRQDINRMYKCVSEALNKVKELETAFHSRQQ
jgi:hypothetical protein